MRQRIDIQRTWERAQLQARIELEEHDDKLIAGLPHATPLSLDELTVGSPDVDALVEKILLLTDRD